MTVCIELNGVTPSRYQHWCGRNPKFVDHLRTWGECGTVKLKTSTSPKMKMKGTQCMMVGHPIDHAGDCYRMYDPETNGIHQTRDVTWMHRMFCTKAHSNDLDQIVIEPTDIEDEADPIQEKQEAPVESQYETKVEGRDEDDSDEPVTRTKAGRVVRPPKLLADEQSALTHEEVAAAMRAADGYEMQLSNA